MKLSHIEQSKYEYGWQRGGMSNVGVSPGPGYYGPWGSMWWHVLAWALIPTAAVLFGSCGYGS